MAPKKTSKKKPSKSKRVVKKKAASPKRAARKKAPPKKAAPSKRAGLKKRAAPRKGASQSLRAAAFEPKGLGARSGGQSGDLQGLSNVAGADSESVDELLEEGNALEAEVVKGVEDVEDADEGEVRTHEVPEDDVPEEYLDKE
jgi:hypothetical protein